MIRFAMAVTLAAMALQGPQRSIAPIVGALYLAKSDAHNTVFYVTPQGIVLADPINRAFSQWLKGELAARFPNRPVRFVLHSHHHFDHAAGAEVWNDTAEIMAHENFGREFKAAAASAPDRYAEVRLPESTFSDRRRITLGGRTVEIIHPGPNHSLDAAVLYFPDERAAFAVDFLPTRRPFSPPNGGAPLADWIASVKAVEALPVTRFVPGHGDAGTRADVTAYRQYLEGLAAAR